MKRIILLNLLLVFYIVAFGQNFTLSELIKINNYQLDDFDTYVTKKGYNYYESKNTDFSEITSYSYSTKGFREAYVSKFYRKKNSSEMVSFQTIKTNTYLQIKAELKTLGYKLINTGSYQGTTYFEYLKDGVEVSLTSIVQDNSNGNNQTSYEISVTRKK